MMAENRGTKGTRGVEIRGVEIRESDGGPRGVPRGGGGRRVKNKGER
jgi:hypothetical protein